MKKKFTVFLLIFSVLLTAAGCSISPGTSEQPDDSAFSAGNSGTIIRILSGSENQELEDIISDCAAQAGVRVEMDYKGSGDSMRELQGGAEDYDPV